ncbi:hypothetical protein, partial [Pseudomonas sp.]|uniref:hypothetical protein n=1 Tax=Pseudomonas sp. TaxID=306 RepID=UPI004054028B
KIPQFFNNSAEPYSEANAYMRFLSRRLMPKSMKTIAEHIKEFLVWSESSGIELVDVTDDGQPQKLSATPDLSGTVLPLCLIPNSALKSAPPFKSVKPKASACAGLLA